MTSRTKSILQVALAAGGILAVWELICTLGHIPQYFVPAPSVVFRVASRDFSYLAEHLAVTTGEALAGFILAASLGFAFSCLLVRYAYLDRIALPYFVAFQSIPIIATAPLFVLWFGSGFASKIAMAITICFFPTTVNSARGLRSISREQLELFQMHGASSWQIFFKLRLPSAVRQIFSGLRISAGFAMIGAIVAEYSGANMGIGYVIMQSTYRLDTPLLFAAILASCVAGLALFTIVVLIESRFFRKYLI